VSGPLRPVAMVCLLAQRVLTAVARAAPARQARGPRLFRIPVGARCLDGSLEVPAWYYPPAEKTKPNPARPPAAAAENPRFDNSEERERYNDKG
jgi:hypothetical protein